MKSIIFLFLLGFAAGGLHARPVQEPDSVLTSSALVDEALAHNPEIRAALAEMSAADARADQTGTLEDPELTYMREGMPGFRWGTPMFTRIELMQMLKFPTKLAAERRLGNIVSDHAHHAHLEKINEVLGSIKSGFVELWYIQQSIRLNRESASLMTQFAQIARTKYGAGSATQPEVLKAQVEVVRLENLLEDLRQRELSTKAMLMGALNRRASDTLGTAVLGTTGPALPSLDSLEAMALDARPMLIHDSLGVEEGHAMASLARQEYLPDLKLGVEYMTEPMTGFSGWSVKAGISIPFAPWTLGKARARVEEADASVRKAEAVYAASRAMVLSSVRDFYYKAATKRRQAAAYDGAILPQAKESLQASLVAYQTGKTDFLMLIDAYRMLVDVTMESLMTRMELEQAAARLEQAVGIPLFPESKN